MDPERRHEPILRARQRRSGYGSSRRAARPSRRDAILISPGGTRSSVSAYGRPRRRGGGRALLGVLALLLVAGAVGVFTYTRPVGAAIAATPADAAIASCECTATGSLALADLEPGTYAVRVERAGFEPLDTSVALKRFSDNEFSFALKPLPQKTEVVVHPEGATVRILAGEREVAADTGKLAAEIPSGSYTVEATLKGCNAYRRDLVIDRKTSLELWLDPKGQLVHSLGMVTTSGAPKAVAITPDGREVWATILNGPPSIEIFDPVTLRRTGTVDIGEHGAVEIEFSADGTRAYASQMETARVFEIDTKTRKVLRSMDTESAWTKVVELSPNGKTAYAANWSGHDVSEIDISSGKLRRRIRTANTPRGLYATEDGAALYVAGFGTGDLDRIDLASGDSKTVFDGGGALRHIVADADKSILYISDMSKDVVWKHDMLTGKTTKFLETDEKPNTIDLSPDGAVLFVSCRGENNSKSYYIPGPEWGTILLFDTETGKPLDAVVGGNQCTALDVSGDGKLLVFSDFLDNRLRFYQVPDIGTLRAGDGGRFKQHFADLQK
ncbi:MAG: YncE family protein [Actinomycetota bacterium]|nr:YncE family protein [Actinomycetota bacterium]